MKAQLCGCNNCMRVLFDENPNGQKEIKIEPSLKVHSMEQLEDEGGYFWGCPHCQTDAHLTDINTEEELNYFIK